MQYFFDCSQNIRFVVRLPKSSCFQLLYERRLTVLIEPILVEKEQSYESILSISMLIMFFPMNLCNVLDIYLLECLQIDPTVFYRCLSLLISMNPTNRVFLFVDCARKATKTLPRYFCFNRWTYRLWIQYQQFGRIFRSGLQLLKVSIHFGELKNLMCPCNTQTALIDLIINRLKHTNHIRLSKKLTFCKNTLFFSQISKL